jgi:hypothetical protein
VSVKCQFRLKRLASCKDRTLFMTQKLHPQSNCLSPKIFHFPNTYFSQTKCPQSTDAFPKRTSLPEVLWHLLWVPQSQTLCSATQAAQCLPTSPCPVSTMKGNRGACVQALGDGFGRISACECLCSFG